MKSKKRTLGIEDEIIGYYATKTEDDWWWWSSPRGLELVIWSSEAEARFDLSQYSEGEFYRHYEPIDFGTIASGVASGEMQFRLSRQAMIRYYEVWRRDMPQIPPIESIDFGDEDMISWPPV